MKGGRYADNALSTVLGHAFLGDISEEAGINKLCTWPLQPPSQLIYRIKRNEV
jgi:hypothetical protein